MIRLRVKEILEEQGHSKYWLNQRLGMCYRNFSNLIENKTTSVRFDTLQKLCTILHVSVSELLEEIPDSESES